MIAAALAGPMFAVVLTAGAIPDPAASTPGRSGVPYATMASAPHQRMQVCESGGMGAETCDVECHIVFNYYTSHCNVACRSGYYACCGCDGGCKCVMDHDEMWPLPPPPPPPVNPVP